MASKAKSYKPKNDTPQRIASRHRRIKQGQPGTAMVPSPTPGKAINQVRNPGPIPRNAKEALELAFKGTGGVPQLIVWAKKNRGEFYTKLWARLIPRDVLLGADSSLEDLLTKLAEKQRGSDTDVIEAEFVSVGEK